MKKIFCLLLIACLLLCGCGKRQDAPKAAEAPAQESSTSILLQGESAEIRGGGAKAEGSVVTVSTVGSYRLSGELNNGQIVVDTGEDAVDVTLILDGVTVNNPNGPALWVKQAKNVHVELAAGSENLLVSGTEADAATLDDSRSGGAVFSEDDLIFEGEGSLTVRGYLNNGITCKDDLKIKSGRLDVLGANNGLRASESVTVSGGEISVTAGNDGLKTSSAEKEGKGYIEISGGSLTVRSGGDAIDAVTELRISGGEIRTETRQDLVGANSRKGLKADQLVEISGGTLALTADEDAIHCDRQVRMSGGEAELLATTGIQAGVSGSGEGDILLAGGTLRIAAVKQALKAEGAIFANNELLALCTSDKQADPHEGGQAWVRCSVNGSAGEEVRVGMGTESFSSPLNFKIVLYTSASLEVGENVGITVGEQSYTAAARG